MKFGFSSLLIFSVICATSAAKADMFGTGTNSFEIEFTTIGSPGNPAVDPFYWDPEDALGSVPYTYRIGTYEISEGMLNKANAAGGLGITHTARNTDDLAATGITWYDAARFVNWLNTSSGFSPAYKFDGGGVFVTWDPGDAGYNPNNLYRNSAAKYFLPSLNEWHKAAYYDPNAGVYYQYPTGSNTVPDGIDAISTPGQDPDFDAVFYDGAYTSQPNKYMNVGIASPFGTFGQGGNVEEWTETDQDMLNDSTTFHPSGSPLIKPERWILGGYWQAPSSHIDINALSGFDAEDSLPNLGFRVASVPEPSSILLAVLAAAGCFFWRRAIR